MKDYKAHNHHLQIVSLVRRTANIINRLNRIMEILSDNNDKDIKEVEDLLKLTENNLTILINRVSLEVILTTTKDSHANKRQRGSSKGELPVKFIESSKIA